MVKLRSGTKYNRSAAAHTRRDTVKHLLALHNRATGKAARAARESHARTDTSIALLIKKVHGLSCRSLRQAKTLDDLAAHNDKLRRQVRALKTNLKAVGHAQLVLHDDMKNVSDSLNNINNKLDMATHNTTLATSHIIDEMKAGWAEMKAAHKANFDATAEVDNKVCVVMAEVRTVRTAVHTVREGMEAVKAALNDLADDSDMDGITEHD
jgi:hypothetical protein